MQWKMVVKLVVLGGVSLVMLFALGSISGLVRERKMRAYDVQRDIANSYAGEQRLAAPVFAVSFREFWTERLYNKEKDTWYDKEMVGLETVFFFPDTFSYAGTMGVEERYRGIYKANVFQSEGLVQGDVVFPEIETLATRKESRLELVSANACILVGDLRGISRAPEFKWNGEPLEIAQGSELDSIGTGIHAELPSIEGLFGKRFEFEMKLDIHGTGGLTFIPVGDENEIKLASAWPHPSFVGDFLATEREVTPDGFTAEWKVNGLACSAQRQISQRNKGGIQQLGVSLVDPVSVYSMTDRALKYGFLFIFITFAAFLMFEMISGLKIHPVQYGFVGLAQSVFFLLLLSLSEHLGFAVSYLGATLATVGLVTLYVCYVLKGLARGLSFGALLLLLYGVLYALLQSEDHALVAGSALIFGLMALVMLLTRKIDWYALGAKREGVVQ